MKSACIDIFKFSLVLSTEWWMDILLSILLRNWLVTEVYKIWILSEKLKKLTHGFACKSEQEYYDK